jgi:hypothetical protein
MRAMNELYHALGWSKPNPTESAAAPVVDGGAGAAIGGGQEQHVAGARALARGDTHHFVVEASPRQATLEARARPC